MDGGRESHGFFLLGAGPEKIRTGAFPWWPYELAFDFDFDALVSTSVEVAMATFGGLSYSELAALPWGIFKSVLERLENRKAK